MEDTVCGFHILVHTPEDTGQLERRVAQAHADAVLDKVQSLACSAEQKRELLWAIST